MLSIICHILCKVLARPMLEGKRTRILFLLKLTFRMEEGWGPDNSPKIQPKWTLRTSVIKERHTMVGGVFGLRNTRHSVISKIECNQWLVLPLKTTWSSWQKGDSYAFRVHVNSLVVAFWNYMTRTLSYAISLKMDSFMA